MASRRGPAIGSDFAFSRDTDRLLDLLRRLPERLFLQMVAKAGLTVAEARELCDGFRRLKE